MGERETGGMGNLEGGCDKGREKRERAEGGRKKERGWECVIRGGRRREERGTGEGKGRKREKGRMGKRGIRERRIGRESGKYRRGRGWKREMKEKGR